MNNVLRYALLGAGLLLTHTSNVWAYKPIQDGEKKEVNGKAKAAWKEYADLMRTTAGCRPAESMVDLDINNVRARMIHAGTMWWDGVTNARYEVPKDSRKNSLFAGSCWVAGIDAENQLKVCAQMFRTSGEDYWPGPINRLTKDVEANTCLAWDKIWKINRVDISEFRALIDAGGEATVENDPRFEDIIKWPAIGNNDARGKNNISIFNDMNTGSTTPGESNYAPFVDVDGNGLYDWRSGDYPDIAGTDQYLWWVFNDKGNTKQNTGSASIGMEVQTSAFAFSTRNALNDMTFINYRLINRGTLTLNDCWMATFTDADLGYAFDDYVGCDTAIGLGILYNGTAVDGTGEVSHYGSDVPMVGVDYFVGPRRDYYDPVSQKDTFELLQMQAFTYFNNINTGSLRNPSTGSEYYRYMTGYTANNEKFSYDYQGRNIPSDGYGEGPDVRFVFWGDPADKDSWCECNAGNAPGDRRFIHSAGPFTLKPGVKNDMTIGAVWVASVGGCPSTSFSKIVNADKLAQEAFDRGFRLTEGPEAPTVQVRELDRKLIFTLTNDSNSNNFLEKYGYDLSEQRYRVPVLAAAIAGSADSLYKFQGYRVFQLKNANTSIADIFDEDGEVNTDVAAEVFQADIQDSITEIRNIDEVAVAPNGDRIYNYPLKVSGRNQGLSHSFVITEDQFAKGADKRLVNYRNYYFIALAYAYNNFAKFNPDSADATATILYLESSHGPGGAPLEVTVAMPNPANTAMGNVINSDYGTGVVVRRIEGSGNGGNDLQIDAATEETALRTNWATHPVYQEGKGPIDVRVIDPVKVPAGNWELYIMGTQPNTADSFKGLNAATASWKLVKDGDTANAIYSEMTMDKVNDQIISKYGLMVKVNQVYRPGDDEVKATTNGYITSDVTFADPNTPWLAGVSDAEGIDPRNWIRSGEFEVGPNVVPPPDCDYNDYLTYDDNQVFEQMFANNTAVARSWAPANLVADKSSVICQFAALPPSVSSRLNSVPPTISFPGTRQLPSIDLVFTADKSKWTRSMVVEMNPDPNGTLSEGNARQYRLRRHASWNGNTDATGAPVYATDPNDTGMSWFPGYAINQETGERVNIFFSEDSWLKGSNGADMLWNPTNEIFSNLGDIIFGGKHFVYVTSQPYDSCRRLVSRMKDNIWFAATHPYRTVAYIGMPLTNQNFKLKSINDGLIPTETRLRFRVNRPYVKFITPQDGVLKNEGNPLYSFSTTGLNMSPLTSDVNPYYSDKQALLDRIGVVPNPYYGYTAYEQNRLDTRVRIINLPQKATVSIYSMDGTLVRQISKDNANQSYLDWDIKNAKGLPIASGMYLVHVNAEGIGETVVKWFGMMRPIDITTY